MVHRVLLIQAGRTLPTLAARFGDYDRWFARALDGAFVRWTVTRPFLGEPLPAPSSFDAVIMTGSKASVNDRAPWMPEAERWLRGAVDRGTPFLGVCFGHQMLAHAFGARIAPNPKGLEIGTVEVALNEEGRVDPLFAGLGTAIHAHQTHEEMAVELPPGVRLLASNACTPVQAIAVGPWARGVQFHPEMTEEIVREAASALGAAPATAPSPDGPRLLRAFLARFSRSGASSGGD